MAGQIVPTPVDALLVIDVQKDFCPGGALAVPDGDQVVAPINALMPLFPLVVLTQDWHPVGHASFASSHKGKVPFETTDLFYGPQVLWPDHCVQGHAGADFHPDLEINRAHAIVRKGFRAGIDSYSAFFENDRQTSTGLAGFLRDQGVSRVFVVGLATDFCVAYTLLDARTLGFSAVLVQSACRAIDLNGSLAAATLQLQEAGVAFAP